MTPNDPFLTPLREAPQTEELREQLAALAHEQWSGWMRYLFEKCYSDHHGMAVVMPRESADRWRRQMNTPYAQLPEAEKDSDRKEADRVLALLPHLAAVESRLRALEAEMREELDFLNRTTARPNPARIVAWADKLTALLTPPGERQDEGK
jgi:hypothetical protein